MNEGLPLALFLCCGWPLIFYAVVEYLKRAIARRDWSNIQWSEFRWPWSKDQ